MKIKIVSSGWYTAIKQYLIPIIDCVREKVDYFPSFRKNKIDCETRGLCSWWSVKEVNDWFKDVIWDYLRSMMVPIYKLRRIKSRKKYKYKKNKMIQILLKLRSKVSPTDSLLSNQIWQRRHLNVFGTFPTIKKGCTFLSEYNWYIDDNVSRHIMRMEKIPTSRKGSMIENVERARWNRNVEYIPFSVYRFPLPLDASLYTRFCLNLDFFFLQNQLKPLRETSYQAHVYIEPALANRVHTHTHTQNARACTKTRTCTHTRTRVNGGARLESFT